MCQAGECCVLERAHEVMRFAALEAGETSAFADDESQAGML